jgi:hypothetical protein
MFGRKVELFFDFFYEYLNNPWLKEALPRFSVPKTCTAASPFASESLRSG